MPADLFDKVKAFTYANWAREQGLYPFYQPLQNSEGVTATFQGHEVIMIGSNNYLGLTTHPKVKQAAIDAIAYYGTSCTGSRFLNGTLEIHLELERRLARFMRAEAALTFTTGYQANVGTITALVSKGDYVIADKEDHASIIDGCLMCRGELRRFSHNDISSLELVLSRLPESAGKLVIVDGVYSMGGDIAPLPDLIAICKKFGARIMVDDAHSIGVLGNGRGTAAHFGVEDQVDVTMGTFSKSFASVGGYISGNADVLDFIRHNARSLIFSASLPPANVATVLACLDIIEAADSTVVAQLWENAEYMRTHLHALGFDTGRSNTPIIPLIIRDDVRTVLTWKALIDAGLYTNPVVPPGVPANMSLLRTSYTSTHRREHLDKALAILAEVGRRMDIIPGEGSLYQRVPVPAVPAGVDLG